MSQDVVEVLTGDEAAKKWVISCTFKIKMSHRIGCLNLAGNFPQPQLVHGFCRFPFSKAGSRKHQGAFFHNQSLLLPMRAFISLSNLKICLPNSKHPIVGMSTFPKCFSELGCGMWPNVKWLLISLSGTSSGMSTWRQQQSMPPLDHNATNFWLTPSPFVLWRPSYSPTISCLSFPNLLETFWL